MITLRGHYARTEKIDAAFVTHEVAAAYRLFLLPIRLIYKGVCNLVRDESSSSHAAHVEIKKSTERDDFDRRHVFSDRSAPTKELVKDFLDLAHEMRSVISEPKVSRWSSKQSQLASTLLTAALLERNSTSRLNEAARAFEVALQNKDDPQKGELHHELGITLMLLAQNTESLEYYYHARREISAAEELLAGNRIGTLQSGMARLHLSIILLNLAVKWRRVPEMHEALEDAHKARSIFYSARAYAEAKTAGTIIEYMKAVVGAWRG